MTTRIVRTREDEEKMHERFTELFSRIKPVPHDIDCIRILKKVKPALDYNRLMIKNQGNKHEKGYRNKRFVAEKDCMLHLDSYIKAKRL